MFRLTGFEPKDIEAQFLIHFDYFTGHFFLILMKIRESVFNAYTQFQLYYKMFLEQQATEQRFFICTRK